MVKKSNILGIAVMLCLAAANINSVFAGDNNLVQLDLHKTSNNAVDMTFFTTNPYQDNIVVRKKSDNKYVILMPKVLTSGYSTPDLNGVKDLVTHIDVKSINDSGNGYTKVTLITTKPLDIKTHAQKSAPVTAEQQEYKTLIAEANAIKNNIGKNNNAPKVQPPQKTNITVNKTELPKKQETKQEPVKQKLTQTASQTAEKERNKNNKVTQITEKIQNQTKEIKENITNKTSEAKQDDLLKNVPDIAPVEETPNTEIQENNNNIKDIKKLPKKQKMSLPSIGLVLNSVKTKAQTIINEVESKMPVGIPTALMFILIPLFGIIMLSKLVKASIANSKALKESFINHLAEQPPLLNTLRYNNIVNDKELTWQEKYQKYLDASAKPVSRGPNKGTYTFIKQPAQETIEQKRQNLESLVTPDLSPQQEQSLNELIQVQNEEDTIQKELHRTIKLKAFAKNENMTNTLSMSHRDKIKSRFKKYEEEKPLKEQKNIELGNSALHSNPRRMKNSNLDLSEAEALKQRAKEMNINENDYVMSSVEEFFSILDNEPKHQEEIKKSTNPITSSIAKIKPALQNYQDEAGIITPPKSSMMSSPVNTSRQITNPISKLRNETKASYINGLIVKSGFNIDESKGFYIVNLDGQSALIGRINDEIFVLKKFDKNVEKPIQVRHDNANVYMVKAADFKSLVEVNEDKMGVLIEL